jgi:Ni,Fe-hydrogenase I small subunit
VAAPYQCWTEDLPTIIEFLQEFNLKLLYHEVLMMQQGIFVEESLQITSDLNSENRAG